MYWITRIWPFAKFGENVYFHGSRDEKKIALTFDDGPCENTLGVLSVLKKYSVRGTFFVLGNKIQGNENILRRIIGSGSEIGSHSYNHLNLSFRPKYFIGGHLNMADNVLRRAGVKSYLFRPPYGSFGFNLLDVCKQKRKKIILWDVDPSDWRCNYNIDKISKYIIRNTRNGSILDLHDYA